MNNHRYLVRRMQPSEVQLAIDWAAAEGWNPGLYDAQTFYQADPNGFFIGLLDNEPVAAASMVCYDEQFAFGGLYIVKPEFRHQGYGMQLIQESMNYIRNRIVGLDGVLAQIDNYAKIGFKRAYSTMRYQFIAPHIQSIENFQLVNLNNIALDEILVYEKQLFPAERRPFLKSWISQPESHALGYYQDGQLLGYTVMRRCLVGYKIGPLFADSTPIAEQLLTHLLSHVPDQLVILDIPELNQSAITLAKKLGMQPGFETIRMYRNGSLTLDSSRIYGVTSLELG